MDKLFVNDKVLRISPRLKLVFGTVVVDSDSSEYKIEWNDGTNELLLVDEHGQVSTRSKVAVLNRSFDVHAKVMNANGRVGTVTENRLLATVSILDHPNVVIEDIPVENLSEFTTAHQGGKILFDEWIGVVTEMTAQVTYRMDEGKTVCTVLEDGKVVTVGLPPHENTEITFPYPGQRFSRLTLSSLWDAEWKETSWFKNIFYYWGVPAVAETVEVDSLTVQWMGRSKNEGCKNNDSENNPPSIIFGETLPRVQYLNGKKSNRIKENCLRKYKVIETKVQIMYNEWEKKIMDVVLNKSSNSQVEIDWNIVVNNDHSKFVHLGSEVAVKVILLRNNLHIQWEDGTKEVIESSKIVEYEDEFCTLAVEDFTIGKFVIKKNEIINKDSQYGVVLKEHIGGIVTVKWVTPLSNNLSNPIITVTDCTKYDLVMCNKFSYLDKLDLLPIVVPVKDTVSDNSFHVGIAIGFNVCETKLEVQCPDQSVRLFWIHEVTRYNKDVVYNPDSNTWDTWYMESGFQIREHNQQVVLNYVSTGPKPHFEICDEVPSSNFFADGYFIPRLHDSTFMIALEEEIISFQGMPGGIWIENYENRADLFTVAMCGPGGTPYENHLLFFDIGLPHDFPLSEPEIHITTFDSEINPSFVNGNVILPLSALEVAATIGSTDASSCAILKMLYVIQNKILVKEPYFNTTTLAKKGSDVGNAYSQEYNEHVVISMLDYAENILRCPPGNWESFIRQFYKETLPKIFANFESYIPNHIGRRSQYGQGDTVYTPVQLHGVPTRADGFTMALKSRLENLRSYLPS